MFRDALDRVAPIHLEWINSREAFMAVLKVRFKDFGLHKIQNGEFALQDTGSADDIDLSDISRDWDFIFAPGQQVDMSVIFKRRDKANSILARHAARNIWDNPLRLILHGKAGANIQHLDRLHVL